MKLSNEIPQSDVVGVFFVNSFVRVDNRATLGKSKDPVVLHIFMYFPTLLICLLHPANSYNNKIFSKKFNF